MASDIYGTEGNDIIRSGNGPDNIKGGGGDDLLNGNKGPDTVDGGSGNDELHGGKGPDLLIGGTGRDQLYGGKGPDTFAFAAGDSGLVAGSFDRIRDFNGDSLLVEAASFVIRDKGAFSVVSLIGADGHATDRIKVFGDIAASDITTT